MGNDEQSYWASVREIAEEIAERLPSAAHPSIVETWAMIYVERSWWVHAAPEAVLKFTDAPNVSVPALAMFWDVDALLEGA